MRENVGGTTDDDGPVAVVVGVVGAVFVVPRCGPPVPSPSVGSLNTGVGSKGSHPAPSIHTSGHACALRLVTWYKPSEPSDPGW